MVGNAIRVGCEKLVKALSRPEGGFYTFEEAKSKGIELRQQGVWTAPCTNNDEKGIGAPFCVYMYGVFMAEVAVEVATGKTTVEKLTIVADIGKVNNRLITDGQIYGGMAQAVGLALTEDFEDIKKHKMCIRDSQFVVGNEFLGFRFDPPVFEFQGQVFLGVGTLCRVHGDDACLLYTSQS